MKAARVSKPPHGRLALVNGRVVLTELGLVNPLTGDKKLLNGYIVSPTGLVTAPGGTTPRWLRATLPPSRAALRPGFLSPSKTACWNCKLPPKVSQSKIGRSSNFSLLLFLTVHEKKSF